MPSQEVQNMIPKIKRYFATQPIERAYLFGSCSRGEETKDSDVDLLVTYSDSNQLSLLTICHMMNELSDTLGRNVDMVEEQRLLPFAVNSVNQDKMLIYERAH
ncbi:MAG: nucleotidyltransferase domain-containing protein [Paludibacteraceae bacterium]|nr:nucleotidyltransferase domain-containing protein [Paludibacteraceae bacterium]